MRHVTTFFFVYYIYCFALFEKISSIKYINFGILLDFADSYMEGMLDLQCFGLFSDSGYFIK